MQELQMKLNTLLRKENLTVTAVVATVGGIATYYYVKRKYYLRKRRK